MLLYLTGGQDSRLVLARAVARATGLTHTRVARGKPEATTFVEAARGYAFHLNGDTSGKRALSDLRLTLGEIGTPATEQSGYGYQPSQIVAAALTAGCRTLYTQDLQAGRRFDSLTVVDPFGG